VKIDIMIEESVWWFCAVWCGEEKWQYKGGDLLCREARHVAVHSKHIGNIRHGDPTMCY